MAILFASLPVAGRLLLGEWGFPDATLLSVLCVLAAAYLYFRGRKFRAAPDPAAMLDQAIQLAASGQSGEAIALLTEAIRVSPRLWQALQYRGEMYLQLGSVEDAMKDFDQAIALAPEEAHIRVLRGYAESLRKPLPYGRGSDPGLGSQSGAEPPG
jgi:tetratricopeptide (TPR) repeat protein